MTCGASTLRGGSQIADRRQFLRGFAAIPLAAAPLAVLPAQAAPATSAEAAALFAEFHDIAGRFNAAGDRLDAAMSATVRIPEPEALFARGQDFWVLGCTAPKRHYWDHHRFSYGTDDVIAQLRALPAGDGDRKRADRRDEIVGAWDRWHAEKAAAKVAFGHSAASAAYNIVGDEHDAFILRLTHMRTSDPGIMAIKAAMVLNMWGGKAANFDGAMKRVLESDDLDEEPLCYSLMRDMISQLGDMHRVKA